MTHTEFMKRINEITERGMAYALSHADEIKQEKAAAKTRAAAKIADVLSNAENAAKHSYNVYESFKNSVSTLAVDSEQYETAVKRLAAILEV